LASFVQKRIIGRLRGRAEILRICLILLDNAVMWRVNQWLRS
jgi:hypothetical protein